MRSIKTLHLGCLAIGLTFVSGSSCLASVIDIPASLPQAILSESVPTAFAPLDLQTDDFEIIWQGAAIPGVELSIETDSMQWVRVMEVLALPRARLHVQVSGASTGKITVAGFTQPFSGASTGLSANVPIALLSGPSNRIDMTVLRDGKEIHGQAAVRFHPRIKSAYVEVDPSCSHFGVNAEVVREQTDALNQWVVIGCRLQRTQTGDHRTSSLELYVLWDQAGESLRVNGADVAPTTGSLWTLRLGAAPGQLLLDSQNLGLSVTYSVPEHLHAGSLGIGVGPYQYQFNGLGTNISTAAAFVNLYGSYTFTETIRVVAFDATAIASQASTDFGIYLNAEDFRIIDRRLGINLLLGGHALAFSVNGSTYFLPGFPQGAELIYSDAFRRGMDLTAGVFIYPAINGTSYYNVWSRWGSSYFVEFNYIAWREPVQTQSVSTRSIGLTFGMPLAKFF